MKHGNLTRLTLLAKRAQISLAIQGRDLLQEKSEALHREFFQIARAIAPDSGDLEEPARVLEYVKARLKDGDGGPSVAAPSSPDLQSRPADDLARLQNLEREIRCTLRKLNALEDVMIPRLEAECLSIEAAIQEQEQQELLQLQRLRKTIEESNNP